MNVFNDFSEAYDVMFPWSVRGPAEEVFYSALFKEIGISSVLDCACGTGMHAVMCAQLGLRTAASDFAPAMVEQTRKNAAAVSVNVDARVASFTDLSAAFLECEKFDAVLCLGNSLTLAPSDSDVATAIAQMHARLNPGGICLLTLFNWGKVQREGLRIMPASRGMHKGQELTFLRVFHNEGDCITLNIAVMTGNGDVLSTQILKAIQRPISYSRLCGYASDVGFVLEQTWADQRRTPFSEENSDNLIMVLRRTA